MKKWLFCLPDLAKKPRDFINLSRELFDFTMTNKYYYITDKEGHRRREEQ